MLQLATKKARYALHVGFKEPFSMKTTSYARYNDALCCRKARYIPGGGVSETYCNALYILCAFYYLFYIPAKVILVYLVSLYKPVKIANLTNI